MKTSYDVIIRHDGVFTWNFHNLQKCPLVFESRNCVLKETIFFNMGGEIFRHNKLNKILNKKDRKSEAMKHYNP